MKWPWSQVADDRTAPHRWARLGVLLVVVGTVATLMGWRSLPGRGPQQTLVGRVIGASMFPTLLGPHWRQRCSNCQFPIVSDTPGVVRCPNCAGNLAGPAEARWQPGQRVVLEPLATVEYRPRRWQLVAIRVAGEPIAVKRVLGLPGERIELRDGDLWVGGTRPRRSLEEIRPMLVLVHDNRYSAGRSVVGEESAAPTNRSIPGGWYPVPDRSIPHETAAWQWQEFRPPVLHGELAITDNYAFNTAVIRQLHRVPDGALAVQLTTTAPTTTTAAPDTHAGGRPWALQYVRGETCWTVCGDLERRTLSVWQDARRLHLQGNLPPEQDGASSIAVACYVLDGRQLLEVDGELIWEGELGEQTLCEPSSARWLIAAPPGGAPFHRLQVWRDLYYYCPASYSAARTFQLAADELFVVGDNVPVSWDSRQSGEPVRLDQVLATVQLDGRWSATW